MSDNFTVDPELVKRDQVGDVFTNYDGIRYKVTKKTRTAIAVERYYWFDEFFDWLKIRIGGNDESKSL